MIAAIGTLLKFFLSIGLCVLGMFFVALALQPVEQALGFFYPAFVFCAFFLLAGAHFGAGKWRVGFGRALMALTLCVAFCAALRFFLPHKEYTGAYALAIDAVQFLAVLMALPGFFMARSYAAANAQALKDIEDHWPLLKDFADRFEKELGPWLDSQEQRRKEALKHRFLAYLLGTPLAAGLCLAISFLPIYGWIKFLLFLVIAGTLILKADKKYDALRSEIKKNLSENIARHLGLHYQPRPDGDRLLSSFESARILPSTYNVEFLRDMYSGNAHGSSFSMFHAHLLHRPNILSQDDRTHTVFCGILIAIEFPQPINGNIRILNEKKMPWKWVYNRITQDQRINLGYSQFEKIFEVYAPDQIEARTVLTPDILLGLIDLAKLVSGDDIVEAAFIQGMLLITIATERPVFDADSLDVSMKDRTRVRVFAEQVAMIYKIIEIMEIRRKNLVYIAPQ